MKTRTKIALFIVASPVIISFVGGLWLFGRSVIPAVQKADINLIDVIKSGGLSDKQNRDIQEYAIEESYDLGKDAGSAIVDILKSMTDSLLKIDTTNMPKTELPYSMDDALNEINEAAAQGIEAGFANADKIIENNDKIRNEILNESDK